MRINVFCNVCMDEPGVPPIIITTPINDVGVYRLKCSRGHETIVSITQQRFQVLAEGAVQAIGDDYYRDAVSGFSACLERFYEFYVRVVSLHKLGSDKLGKIDKTWKIVSRMSERQLGMYFASFLLENGDVPPRLDDDIVKFRNKVVHQGYLPTRDEAIDYGQKVMDVLQPVLWDTADRYKDEILDLSLLDQKRMYEQTKDEADVSRSRLTLHLDPQNYQRVKFDVRQQVESRRSGTALRIRAFA